MGYSSSLNDYSLFSKITPSSTVFIAVYVDDILLVGNDTSELDSIKSFLDNQFKIKDLGSIHYFLGLEVSHLPQGLLVNQHKYLKELLTEFHCDSASLVVTSLDMSIMLTPTSGDPLADASPYRRLIRKLNFLQHTRPDISFSVQHLSQFLNAPRTAHMKSVTGYYVTLGDSPVTWKFKKQPTVSLSSAEAEYRALRKNVAELTWLVRLLADLGLSISAPIPPNSFRPKRL
uniref:Uncharacterized mitochondrial protein AtMg00810-like n=1 Tax=Nicotiana tabacum TaxID=4097 RepID=A0A1S3YWZ5_TOBAC|nr:PREDICTED: uncharacterized mitochondrial protein AtMg00810-like [Nicotiana tabacum]